jgi:lysophospholipase L1-like esterase
MRALRSVILNVITAGIAVVVCAGLVEISLRLFYPAADRYYVLPPSTTETMLPLEEHVPGVSGEARYVTSSWGIRGPEFGDPAEYRILAIGGSTTQNAYLDQSESWTLQLGTLLNDRPAGPATWTGDIGRSGHTAPSHVLQLRYVVPQLPRVDAVVSLVGVNDLTVALRQGYDYAPPPPLTDPTELEERTREAFIQVPGPLHRRMTQYQQAEVPWFKRLALYQLAREARNRLRARSGGTAQGRFGEVYETWRAHRAAAEPKLDSLPDLTAALGVYRGYLEEMVGDADRFGVRMVFITQPVLWRGDLAPEEEARLWLGGTGDFQSETGHEYFSAGALRRAMHQYNATMLDVCASSSAECIDLASVLPSDTTIFYDDVHFTEAGSRRVAEVIAAYFAARPPYGDADSAAGQSPSAN